MVSGFADLISSLFLFVFFSLSPPPCSLKPCLLIVMDFVDGGTLSAYIEAQNPAEPPSLDAVMKILTGSAKGLEYLHAWEPMPILHRDIKSENILLTKDLDPRIADLGEARAMARDQAMTIVRILPSQHDDERDSKSLSLNFPNSDPFRILLCFVQVGTNGYTAPEVLKGEHYGTPADVFSFAIVMSELLTLRAPYSDIMKGDNDGKDGNKAMSWDQIVALTHKEDVMLRPTLPDGMDREVAALVRSSWENDPALRPSFSVILVRLDAIARREESRSGSTANRSTLERQDVNSMRFFLRSVHDLIWLLKDEEWDEKAALAVCAADIAVTAVDDTLSQILASEKGLECIKSLSWLMFGGLEDGAEIIPEPLLDEDIVCDVSSLSSVVTFHFAVKPPAKRIQWRVADTKEFDALGRALAEMEKTLAQPDNAALEKAVVESKDEPNARRRRLRRKLPANHRGNTSKKNKDVQTFMKAAKVSLGHH